ncbi:MAG: saccharopine dehydrogenase NADP-binding domain-containing protein [Nannocystaceae bacterium]
MTPATGADRSLDLLVFGATGFVGRLIAEYLARAAPPTLRWGIAGRSRAKLEAIAAACAPASPPIVVADVDDPRSLRAMAEGAAVLLTTVGPYIRWGEPVADACIDAGTHYLDLTGEPAYVARLVERHHDRALARGVALIPCSGFDCVPADLGAYATARLLPEDRPISIRAVMSGMGSMSGGTAASLLEALVERSRGVDRAIAPREVEGRRIEAIRGVIRREPALGLTTVNLPTVDGAIVRRSAGLLRRYGPEFRYGHAMDAHGPIGAALTLALGGALVGAAQIGPLRRALLRLRPSGSGPSPAVRARSWFKMTFVGEAGDARVITAMRGGDPGYDETAKMVSEAAITLWRHGPQHLPGGVLTPAVALGDPYLARLGEVGLGVETIG